jgi:hypothetical protein
MVRCIALGVWDDPRLGLLRAEWFAGRRCLVVGCNAGLLTMSIANKFRSPPPPRLRLTPTAACSRGRRSAVKSLRLFPGPAGLAGRGRKACRDVLHGARGVGRAGGLWLSVADGCSWLLAGRGSAGWGSVGGRRGQGRTGWVGMGLRLQKYYYDKIA